MLIQSPNFFGTIEDVAAIADIAHKNGALLVVSIAEAVSLGHCGAAARRPTSCAMEAQSFGVPLGFGGPYCGVIATREKFVRQMPGRLAGQTIDRNGKRGFVLTLATREQHIRREKATSNICTNQALVALMVNIFMTVYGKVGLKELAKQNLAKAAYAADQFGKHAKRAVYGRAALQRICGADQRRSVRDQQSLAGPQDRRWAAAEEVLSGTGQCGAVVLHRDDDASSDRHRCRHAGRKRSRGAQWRARRVEEVAR